MIKTPIDLTQTSTNVDLGDDLLQEKTRVLNSSPEAARKSLSDDPIRDAGILIREGLLEDAKKILYRIISEGSSTVEARQMLDQLHELELKQIFSGDERKGSARNAEPPKALTSTEALIRQLEEDLGLPLSGQRAELSLFEDAKFTADSADMRELAASDQMDLGIAFLEMGLIEQAISYLQAACRSLMQRASQKEVTQSLVEATALLAFSLIAAGRAMEATATLEPILRDTDIDHGDKLDLLYLMGRAYEALKMVEPAQQWYRQVQHLDARYRDVEERLRNETRS